MSVTNPLRFPDLRSGEMMTRRAWWFVGLNLLLPGSVQVLAGSRRLGRIGLLATFAFWMIVIAALVTFWLAPGFAVTLAANPWVLLAAQVLLVALGLLWLLLALDTLRLARLVRAAPRSRPAIAVVAILGLIVSSGVAFYGSVLAGSARSAITAVFDDGDYVAPAEGRYNILLLGGDAGPDREGLRPDSISVASVDAQTGATVMIGIPRNMERIRFSAGSPLWSVFPNGYDCGDDCLISYLYTYGEEHPELYPDAEASGSNSGIEAMRDAVSGVLDLELQFYVLIDMQGFADLIDALGGVTVDVPARTPLGPVTAPKPYAYLEPGVQKLDGATALWYARSRYDGNDYQRMARQRQVQQAILREFSPANVLARFQDVADAGAQVVHTDIPSVMLGLFVELAAKSRELPVVDLELVPPDFNPAHPDYGLIEAALEAAFAEAAEPAE